MPCHDLPQGVGTPNCPPPYFLMAVHAVLDTRALLEKDNGKGCFNASSIVVDIHLYVRLTDNPISAQADVVKTCLPTLAPGAIFAVRVGSFSIHSLRSVNAKLRESPRYARPGGLVDFESSFLESLFLLKTSGKYCPRVNNEHPIIAYNTASGADVIFTALSADPSFEVVSISAVAHYQHRTDAVAPRQVFRSI